MQARNTSVSKAVSHEHVAVSVNNGSELASLRRQAQAGNHMRGDDTRRCAAKTSSPRLAFHRCLGRINCVHGIGTSPSSSSDTSEELEEPVHALLRSVVTGAPLRVDERLLLHSDVQHPGLVLFGTSTLADEVLTRWQRWRDDGPEWVSARVADIFFVNADTPHARHVVMLQDQADPTRFLPIWVGPSEGSGIAVLLAETEMPRPTSIVIMGRLLSAAGGKVREVRINRLLDQTYFAEIVVIGPDGEQVLDARPSDALGVALHMRAPLAVAANVFEVAATYDITLPEPSVASRICEAMRQTWNRPRWLKAASPLTTPLDN